MLSGERPGSGARARARKSVESDLSRIAVEVGLDRLRGLPQNDPPHALHQVRPFHPVRREEPGKHRFGDRSHTFSSDSRDRSLALCLAGLVIRGGSSVDERESLHRRLAAAS